MQTRRKFLSYVPAGALGLSASTMFGGKLLAADDDAMKVAWHVDVSGWDPSANSSPATLPIHRSVFDTPLDLSADFKLSPNVASGYRWLDKEGKILELTIREGVTFHNGDPLTSDDFKFTF